MWPKLFPFKLLYFIFRPTGRSGKDSLKARGPQMEWWWQWCMTINVERVWHKVKWQGYLPWSQSWHFCPMNFSFLSSSVSFPPNAWENKWWTNDRDIFSVIDTGILRKNLSSPHRSQNHELLSDCFRKGFSLKATSSLYILIGHKWYFAEMNLNISVLFFLSRERYCLRELLHADKDSLKKRNWKLIWDQEVVKHDRNMPTQSQTIKLDATFVHKCSACSHTESQGPSRHSYVSWCTLITVLLN